MAGPMGYRNYRGRSPKWKAVLAVVLVLVILAAIAVIRLQQYIVYDETGTPHLPLLWQEQPDTPDTPGTVDITIEEPEQMQTLQGFFAPVPLGRENWSHAYRQAEETFACNAVAVTLKDSQGNVYFNSAAALPGTVQVVEEETDAALDAVLSLAEQGGPALHTIACLSCFHDPKAAGSDVEGMGLKNTGGYIFYDGNNSQWLDPGKPAARQYLCEIAKEAASMGFDELLLTDVSYPTEGKLDKIYYGDTAREENLRTFLEELRAALEPYGTALSIEVPAEVITEGADSDAGLALADIAPLVDRIYARAAPEQIEALTAAVEAAEGSAGFVPELETYDPAVTGSFLLTQ